MNKGKEKIYSILDELNIKYIKHEHEAVYTIEEVNNLQLDIEGQHCKTYFLEIEKEIYTIFLFCVMKNGRFKGFGKGNRKHTSFHGIRRKAL